MEFWLNINQKKAIEWNINLQQASICSFYAKENGWVKIRILDKDGDFLFIAPEKLSRELPLLKTADNIRKILDSLVEKGIFSKCSCLYYRNKKYYRFNKKYLNEWKRTKQSDFSPTSRINSAHTETNLQHTEDILSHTEKNMSNYRKYSDNHINYDHTNRNQINNNNKDEDDFKTLLSYYPQTINNKSQQISKAFAIYQSFDKERKSIVLKAVKHYAKTEYIYSKKNDTKFIPSIHSFLLKNEFEEVLKQPMHNNFSENFETSTQEVGYWNSFYTEEERIELKKLISKINLVKNSDHPDIEKTLGKEYFKIYNEKIGPILLSKNTAVKVAECIIDTKKEC